MGKFQVTIGPENIIPDPEGGPVGIEEHSAGSHENWDVRRFDVNTKQEMFSIEDYSAA